MAIDLTELCILAPLLLARSSCECTRLAVSEFYLPVSMSLRCSVNESSESPPALFFSLLDSRGVFSLLALFLASFYTTNFSVRLASIK